jgi:hypothetical protein
VKPIDPSLGRPPISMISRGGPGKIAAASAAACMCRKRRSNPRDRFDPNHAIEIRNASGSFHQSCAGIPSAGPAITRDLGTGKAPGGAAQVGPVLRGKRAAPLAGVGASDCAEDRV